MIYHKHILAPHGLSRLNNYDGFKTEDEVENAETCKTEHMCHMWSKNHEMRSNKDWQKN